MWDTALMEHTSVPSLLPHLWKSTLVSGILALVLGILVLAWPGITILVAAIIFGAHLLVTGITQVIFAFSLHVSAGGRYCCSSVVPRRWCWRCWLSGTSAATR